MVSTPGADVAGYQIALNRALDRFITFPYTGSAIISGSFGVTGSAAFSTTSGKTEDIVLSPLNTIGTSNCTTEDKIELFPSEPLVLTIIPRDFLIPASLALLASKAWSSKQK